jgi:hypothetical protein
MRVCVSVGATHQKAMKLGLTLGARRKKRIVKASRT